MSRLGIVIPVYKESVDVLKNAVHTIRRCYPEAEIIVVADDKDSMLAAQSAGVFVPYHSHRLGFGKSLCEGLCLAWFSFGCEAVVIADSDHPIEAIDRFLSLLSDYDVVVGDEKGTWKRSRVWSNRLVQALLFDDVANPTCGFQVWKSTILKQIPWHKVKSSWDMVHVELLFWAKHEGAKITECEFDEVPKERIYPFKRYVSWAVSLFRLIRLKYVWRVSV